MSDKRRILFVDDDPTILTSIEKALRGDQPRWDMVFALGGEAGLVELKRARFDVIVSDLQMPGIDGAALLEHVRLEFPKTVRIILSGSESSAVPVAHKLLAKPCSAVILRATILGLLDDR